MTVYDELVARGLIAQVTDEDEIKELVNNGKAVFYIGGDPSGRTDMRQMMTKETINHNVECFKKQMSRFIDFSDGKAMLVNNADWLLDLNYVELLREVGACFSVNNMLRPEIRL